MRDFPIFTTEYGVSSLVLRENPYRKEAYINIRDVQPGKWQDHMKECVSFCRMAGAEKIYASGDGLETWPVYTRVIVMQGQAVPDSALVRHVFPVTEETVSHWRQLHNEVMRRVDKAGTLEKRDEAKILAKPGACFVHESGHLLGIGWLEDNKLLAVAAVEKGAGRRVMHTLLSLMEGETITLEVASTNQRAICLYDSLGFLKTGVSMVWHDVTGLK